MLVRIPATSANLGPGFDSLGLALRLYNTFNIVESPISAIKIKGEGENNPKLVKDNNFVKIFNNIYEEFSGERANFAFSLENNIPISRGLGSSSAVIIGAIVAAFEALKIKYTKEMVLSRAISYEKHPDNITPALNGGFCVAITRANRVFYTKTRISDEIRAVVVIPNRAMSTRLSRKNIPHEIPLQDAVFNLSRAAMIASIFGQKRWNMLKVAAEDKIHQDRRMALYPVLFSIRKEALKSGALMSVLSGSGSSFLSICLREDSAKIAANLAQRFSDFRVLELDFDNDGASIF